MVKKVFFVLFLFFVVLVQSCRCHKDIGTSVSNTETNTEIRYERIVEKDTVLIEIPAQSAEVVTKDSTSYLQNDYAESLARINLDGTLYHDLRTKNISIGKEVNRVVERRDSVVYRNQEVQVPVPVETPLTKWQKFRLDNFIWIVLLALAEAIWIFRKPFLTLFRKILKGTN